MERLLVSLKGASSDSGSGVLVPPRHVGCVVEVDPEGSPEGALRTESFPKVDPVVPVRGRPAEFRRHSEPGHHEVLDLFDRADRLRPQRTLHAQYRGLIHTGQIAGRLPVVAGLDRKSVV